MKTFAKWSLLACLLIGSIVALNAQQPPTPAAEDAGPTRAQQLMGDIAPKLAELTDEVLYADVWARPQLSRRDRSLVTVSALVAMNRPDQLRSHLTLAKENGVTETELVEAITHLAFYAGWPNAVTAIGVAKEVLLPTEAGAAADDPITVERPGSQTTAAGPAEHFTGSVRVDSRFQRTSPARAGGGIVSFAPGARTDWHSHPLGQTLIVTLGAGLVQAWGGPVQEITPGDVVWIPPGVKHWHGATPDSEMSHIAIVEAVDGKTTDWMEQVTDVQYPGN